MELSYMLTAVASWVVVSVPVSLLFATFIAGGREAQVQVVSTTGRGHGRRETRLVAVAPHS
jgi:hypothetical protein